MRIQPVDANTAAASVALLGELRVSLFGVCSGRLHSALVADGLDNHIDCRVAVDSSRVQGVVLSAPQSYWRSALLRHLDVAIECLRARATRRHAADGQQPDDQGAVERFRSDAPPRTWNDPGDAWRIIFVGTAPRARGQGVAARLYRDLMADRSLVARVALDNAPSIHLHRSLGWQLYRDGDVALAVHLLR